MYVPVPVPVVVPTGGVDSLRYVPYDELAGLVARYFGPAEVPNALRVAFCESTYNVLAYNAGNYGVFQINAIHWQKVNGPLERLYELDENVRVASVIWKEQGWGPWSCKP